MSLAEISKYWWPVRPPSRPVPPDRLARLVSQHWTPDLDVGRNFSISSFCLFAVCNERALEQKKKHQASSPASPSSRHSPPRVQSQSQKRHYGPEILNRIASASLIELQALRLPGSLFPLRVALPAALRVSFLSCLDPFVETLIALHLPDGLPKPKLLIAPPGMQSC